MARPRHHKTREKLDLVARIEASLGAMARNPNVELVSLEKMSNADLATIAKILERALLSPNPPMGHHRLAAVQELAREMLKETA